MNGRNFAHGVDFGTSGWYKARIRGGSKWLILLWLQERADNPFLGTIAHAHGFPACGGLIR